MRRLGSLLIGAGLATLLFPAAALGCTTPQSQPLEQVVQDEEMFGEQLVGVHEQRHIARFPAVPILVNERSASVVVRYWGEEPDLSVASHGDEGIFLVIETSCGSPARRVGFESVHVNSSESNERPRSSVTFVYSENRGTASDVEASLLEQRFGSPVEVSIGVDDYVVAWALLLWRPGAVFGTLGLVGYGLVRRARAFPRDRSSLDGPIVAAGFAGMTAAALVVESYGVVDWLALVAALAGSMFMGWILRVPWTAFAVGYAVYFSYIPDPLRVGLGDVGDRRLQAAVGGLIIAVGGLAWSRRHWTRYVSSFLVLASSYFFTLGAIEMRGYTNMTKASAVALIVTAGVGVALWWLVFRERRLSSGALAEPRGETAAADQPQPSQ